MCPKSLKANSIVPDPAIVDLDRAINLGPPNFRAHYFRGVAQSLKRDWREAINSFERAIELSPNASDIYAFRGNARLEIGDESGALADFDRELQINPNAEIDYGFQIGRLQVYLRDYAASAVQMSRAVDMKPTDIYRIVWWYLAAAKSSSTEAVASELGQRAELLGDGAWPMAVVDLYRGNIDLAAMYTAARVGSPKDLSNRLCEADFYGAEWLLLHGRPTDATTLFVKAGQSCPVDFYERKGAQAELRWLKGASSGS